MDSVLCLGSEKYGIKHKKLLKSESFKTSFQQTTMNPKFFEIFFRRKCSLRSCATFSENMVSISILSIERFASQV